MANAMCGTPLMKWDEDAGGVSVWCGMRSAEIHLDSNWNLQIEMTFGSPPVPFLRILRDPHTHEQVVTHEMRPPAEHDFANLEQLRDAVQGAKPRLFGNQAGDEGVRQGHNVQHAENETKTEDDRFPTFRAPRRRTRQERPPHHAHVQTSEEREVGHTRKTGYGHVSGGGDLCSVLEKVTLFDIRITSRVRLCRSTMACFSMAGLHAVTRMHTITACSRRPFEPMRATLHDAREPAALAGFCSRSPRVKPHALRHTKQSIWMDQARRHGRALGDTRTPRRWAMTPSNESTPSEGEAARNAYITRRCVLPLSSLVYDLNCQSSV